MNTFNVNECENLILNVPSEDEIHVKEINLNI